MGESYKIKDQQAIYFLTFQVVGWADIFSRQIYRDILLDSFKFCIEEKSLVLYGYVIMTNHVHCLLRCANGSLSDVVRDFKRFTSTKILKEITENQTESRKEWLLMVFKYHAKFNRRNERYQFWTQENHAVELTSNSMIESRIDYIHNNPVRSGWVDKPEDYLYSSARNYLGEEGMLKVELI